MPCWILYFSNEHEATWLELIWWNSKWYSDIDKISKRMPLTGCLIKSYWCIRQQSVGKFLYIILIYAIFNNKCYVHRTTNFLSWGNVFSYELCVGTSFGVCVSLHVYLYRSVRFGLFIHRFHFAKNLLTCSSAEERGLELYVYLSEISILTRY